MLKKKSNQINPSRSLSGAQTLGRTKSNQQIVLDDIQVWDSGPDQQGNPSQSGAGSLAP